MSRFALIAIGYNRILEMIRLLKSLELAEYDESVDLIISLDNCGKADLENAVADFEWKYGEKKIRTFSERQGLRNHILSCGDFLYQYDAIAVFEDDIIVSPAFFSYMKQCVEYYGENEEIAGISLYSYKLNVNNNLPFEPEPGEKDVFMLQFAPSWGQVWMKKQWFAFKEWYENNSDKPLESLKTPELICKWPKTSWLKYHIKYCIETNKYFVYPYNSLTTCFSDVGEHCKEKINYFQVALMAAGEKKYKLGRTDDRSLAKYDAFFERVGLEYDLEIPLGELCVDIYGVKNNRERKRYWLTRRELPYKAIKKYALSLRPQECNIIYNIEGEEIYLYDTQYREDLRKENKRVQNSTTVSYYYNYAISWKNLFDFLWIKLKKRMKK